ncbi:hypothetical protein [Achromobacter sp. DMS1]|uniref:hypothetical protein n=1 Tax=Achromobacter sp. DMS1 TaxID=1688405 RepID=UPI001F3B09F2|nr:hypothetical protein [Achromobacter sp. DMS1]
MLAQDQPRMVGQRVSRFGGRHAAVAALQQAHAVASSMARRRSLAEASARCARARPG